MAKQTSLSSFFSLSSESDGRSTASTSTSTTTSRLCSSRGEPNTDSSFDDDNPPQQLETSFLERTIVDCEKFLIQKSITYHSSRRYSGLPVGHTVLCRDNRKQKQITLPRKWLWLRYIPEESDRGGWCLFILEKTSLGNFVKTPKELITGHYPTL